MNRCLNNPDIPGDKIRNAAGEYGIITGTKITWCKCSDCHRFMLASLNISIKEDPAIPAYLR